MITEYILFTLPAGISKEAVIQGMHDIVPRWLGRPALIRKTFVYDAAANEAGAFYLWHNIEAAQLAHTTRRGGRAFATSTAASRWCATSRRRC